MKVNGHHQHEMSGAAMRHAAKTRSDIPATKDATAPAPTTLAATPTGAASPAPVESTVDMAARKPPPGLVRVAARFEAMGVEGRSGGQSNALAQITRNLQRYIETQGVAPPPAPLPNAPVAAPTVAGSSTDTLAPAVTPSDGGVAAADAELEAPLSN